MSKKDKFLEKMRNPNDFKFSTVINNYLKSLKTDEDRSEFLEKCLDGICPICKSIVNGMCYCDEEFDE